ncbi:MAG TPA: group 1 truncated hemoglobin [Caulobacteraceae bacterium]|jgi:hemoglobin
MISKIRAAGLALSIAAGLAAAPLTAFAAEGAANRAGADPIAGDGVFKAFHGKEGIDRLVDDFVVRVTSDPRIAKRFEGADLANLRLQLKAQFCYLVGGPCTYEGKDMKATHAGMGLQNRDFNDLAEDLQISMDKEHVAFQAQNQLLAKLAPMQRVIVTK